MKKIFCPKCDEEIVLSKARLRPLLEAQEDTLSVVCNACAHQMRIRLKTEGRGTDHPSKSTPNPLGHLIVVENSFGYKQLFPLNRGVNRIGRRNKDTETDIPIITGDPSMDRHHAIIQVKRTKQGELHYILSDNDSRVGTFVGGRLLEDREQYRLRDGDVFTLGATSIIFGESPLSDEDRSSIEENH